MNTGEYIATGILEAYVMGALPPAEMQEVAANVARYQELAAEVAAIEDALMRYAGAKPPQHLEEEIWRTIEADETKGRTATEAQNASRGRAMPLPNGSRMTAQWQMAAAMVILAGSLALNIYLWGLSDRHAASTTAMATRLDSLATAQGKLAQEIDKYRKAQNMMADTTMQTIVMHTMVKGHPMAATLYWSRERAEAHVSAEGLPVPPQGMQYQLWVMMDGKPVDMGILPNDMPGTPTIMRVNMKVREGQAFAISLEKAGGSATPTMENIYVMGKA